jgi:hypothetical protein
MRASASAQMLVPVMAKSLVVVSLHFFGNKIVFELDDLF